MKPSAFQPVTQVFVCTNRRPAGDALQSGCGDAGPLVFAALKRATLGGQAGRGVWVTATHCMGLCPREGCGVAIEPAHRHLVDVTEADVPTLIASLGRRP